MKEGRIPDQNRQLLKHPNVNIAHVDADGGIFENYYTR
jgi:hypothetical protein